MSKQKGKTMNTLNEAIECRGRAKWREKYRYQYQREKRVGLFINRTLNYGSLSYILWLESRLAKLEQGVACNTGMPFMERKLKKTLPPQQEGKGEEIA